ncbi:MAG TPA: alpha/beta fold hydrolase [Roseiflexaceae bacterium]|nr:alpha/beta fold hydrolase [Roseiflexaceae bacterium]
MRSPLGVLILHGFTSCRATVEAVVPQAEALGLPWRLPQLRGHWTRYQDLHGVTYYDWLSDARSALGLLRREAERVVVVGLSMGGVLTLDLVAEQPRAVDSFVVLAPALRFATPLARFSPLLARVVKEWHAGNGSGFADQSLVERSTNYTAFPAATFVSLYQAARRVEARLPRISAPALILGSRQDRVVQPLAAQLVYDRIGSTEKELVWFERSGHEMLLDCEGDAVAARVGLFLEQRLAMADHRG